MVKQSFFKKIFSSKPISYLLILCLFFALVSLGREINRQIRLQKEFSRLEEQSLSLEEENEKLLQDLEKIKTDYFKEKAAREKLGLRKSGEQMIVVVSESPEEKEINLSYFGPKISNFRTWWKQFFSKEKED